ncbi:AAA domain-containing protein [Bacillus sp. OTU530]|uniref:AAA domain-containing protein n=1 Tax=Bacillus sp. OTU530 TaxID=3043862 RepID=UPI00313B3DB1
MKEKLGHMRDKLNDISKRNRSIRLLKLYNKWSFDLAELDKRLEEGLAEQIVKKILSSSKQDISVLYPKMSQEESLSISKKLTDLYRNMKGIEDESGVYDFYLGYPFVAGTMLDGTFFQAPLFLYPVRLEKENTDHQKWVLKRGEGESQINRTLFLAFKKVNGISFSDEWLEEASELALKQDFQQWVDWLKKFDQAVAFEPTGITKLKEYKKDEIPELANMSILEYAVLGNFPQGGSSLVKDYEELIKWSEEGDLALVEELIEPKDWMSDNSTLGTPIEAEQQERDTVIHEEDKLYLLQTDGSQEEILKESRFQKGLVVHGPPGTGKSQVIVNLITDALHQGKKILVVCQKRAALDVIYQRLDSLNLSQHVALIHDEKNDRKELYAKIQQILSQPEPFFAQAAQELENTSKRIAAHESLLNRIAKALFEYQDFGYRLYDLYGKAKPMEEADTYVDLSDILSQLNKEVLEDTLIALYTYGEWYERFGAEHYPLKMRKSFTKLEMKDKLSVTETLNVVLERARQSVLFIQTLNHDKITPAYTWLVNNKIEKIYEDLDPVKKRTLQGLRLWWWTSFTGKQVIEELLHGNKFKGLNSSEWLQVREGLKTIYELANETLKMSQEIEKLKRYMKDDVIEKMKERISQGDIPIEELDKMLEYLHRDFDDLRQMDSFFESSSELTKTLIKKLTKKAFRVDEQVVSLPELWVNMVRNSAYVHWIDQIEKQYPDVQKVSSNEFNRIRDLFAQAIDEKREIAKKFLRHQLGETSIRLKTQETKAMKDLNHQVTKKRQIWPLRRLVDAYVQNGLLELLPVWLASPETVSSIFPLKEGLFDVVIFDEASQCTVESGIPVVYRGKQVIVAGDEKQLPPFNMFQVSVINDEDEDAAYDIDESQSLLNLAKRRFPEKILQWHYRSKSEELINFSNHAFYHGQVQIAPNVEPFKAPPALLWKKVQGRWINQCNEIEAIQVVETLKQLLIGRVGKSIGVITFNAKQQDKILDIIDKKLQEDPEFNALYTQIMGKELDERIFVKNIENVQGDERDIIVFSIGYAQNEEGKIFNRFGMLNQQGGENRLNVAVTRAKEEIIVVSSVEPEELNVSNTAHIGPRLLKSYLKYVKSVSNLQHDQVKSVIQEIGESVNTQVQQQELHFDSPFEEQVYNQLKNLGYEVTTQVGMSGYRIDLAVVHPGDPQRYVLGIECDGAMYHSSPNAKERDVYRQRFLESRGWNIERIWSRNWWKNPSAEIERIDHMIKQLMKKEEVREKVTS